VIIMVFGSGPLSFNHFPLAPFPASYLFLFLLVALVIGAIPKLSEQASKKKGKK